MADFMVGYTCWMVRLGIRSTKWNDEVTGATRANATVEDLMNAAGQMADMIDQKFSLCNESVLV